uniref:Uncharacterized protein n=1 Tax=Anguilla anguilla TaxID=7936 RepID=A0A0E9TEJ2_ANGAN
MQVSVFSCLIIT